MRCLVIMLLILTFAAVHADRCSPCSCLISKRSHWTGLAKAQCVNLLSLTAIPNSLPTDIDVLDIRNSSIASLNESNFKYFTKLQVIYIAESQLIKNNIHPHTFKYMINVTEISLTNNAISLLPTNLFADTPKLAVVFLFDNKLTVLQQNLFANLKYLSTLALQRNQIAIIEKDCFVNVPLLEHLYLDHNLLKSLTLSTTVLNSLQVLPLHNNSWHCDTLLYEVMNATVSRKLWYKLPTCATPKNLQDKPWSEMKQDMLSEPCIPCSCVDNFTVAECTTPLQLARIPYTLPQHVNVLRVTDQNLTILEENQFTYLNQLEDMNLERNFLNNIKPNAFKYLKKMALLTLTNNNITQLHKDTFSFTSSLRKLWLNKNNLIVLHKSQFSNLSSLQELDISHNKISFIDYNCFINLSSLQTINLSFNNLQNLQLSIINDLSSLKNLYLNGNPWQCDDSLCEVMNAAVSGRIWTGDNDPTCATPHKLKGKRWHQIYDHFQPRIFSNISSVEEGHDITLQCKYCFVSNVMWTFNGIKLSRNLQQVSDTSLLSTLTVKNTRKEEQGYYVCHVDDCRRCEDAWLHVKVRGRRHQDAVDMKEVFHITANSSYNYTRRGIILLSYTILQDEEEDNED